MTEQEQRLELASQTRIAGIVIDELVKENGVCPIYERKNLSELCIRLLKNKQNIIMVGENGVGKNAIMESIALRMAKSEIHDFPFEHIVKTSPILLTQQWMYAGDIQSIISMFVKNCHDEKAIIFFDKISHAIGYGRTMHSPNIDLISIFEMALSKYPDICVVGATNVEGYHALQKTHATLMNKFVKVEVPPTTKKETLDILKIVAPQLLKKYNINAEIDNDVLELIVEYYDRFCHWKEFPGKTLEALKEIILSIPNKGKTKRITKDNVIDHMQKFTGLPKFIIADEPKNGAEIEKYFNEKIINQKEASKKIADAIILFKTQLTEKNKPIASFLFVGPSGTGKTEMAKVLAEFLFGSKEKLFVYPMSQFSIEKLLKDVSISPFSVILLDEIDQSPITVRNTLYQILDEGKLMEPNGKTTYFRNCIIIMTTNIGMNKFFYRKIGLDENQNSKKSENLTNDIMRELENEFGTPFLNRLTSIVIFYPRSINDIKLIIKQIIKRLSNNLPGIKNRNLKIAIDDEIIQLIIKQGYNEKYGIRKIENKVKEFCIVPIAKFISQNPKIKNEKLHISLDSECEIIVRTKNNPGGDLGNYE